MTNERYYEVEGAVFREAEGRMHVFDEDVGKFTPYDGDRTRVRRQSNVLTLEEVKPYMTVRPPRGRKMAAE